MTARQRETATRTFAAFCALDGLEDALRPREAGARQAGFSTLYAYVADPDRPMSPALRRALASNTRLRADLDRLLGKAALFHGPRKAAASTGSESSRRGTGFTIRLRASRAEPSQIFVVIDVLDLSAGSPRTLFVSGPRDRVVKQVLPEADGGTIQLLAEADSDLVQALDDPKSEVFLS